MPVLPDSDTIYVTILAIIFAPFVAGYITPVPGGVGPMTITMLMENTIECFLNRQ